MKGNQLGCSTFIKIFQFNLIVLFRANKSGKGALNKEKIWFINGVDNVN